MKAPLVGLLVNPSAARHGRHPRRLLDYERLMGDRGPLWKTEGRAELPDAARAFFEAGVEVLALAGGDGTVHAALNAFLPVYGTAPLPPILIVQAGTINNMSAEIGMRRSGLKVLHDFLNGRMERPLRLVRRTLMRVNDHHGFLYGSGFPTRLLERYYQAPRQSPARALMLVLRSLACAGWQSGMEESLFGRMKAQITVDGKSREMEDLIFVLASTILKIGLNFRPCHLALSSENAFHLMASSSSLRSLCWGVHRLYLGRPLGVEGCLDTLAREVLIELDVSIPYMVDGELKERARTHLIQKDRAVSFVVDLGEA